MKANWQTGADEVPRDVLDLIGLVAHNPQFVGGSFFIVTSEKVLLSTGYGAQAMGSPTPINEETAFPIGSISKSLIALCLQSLFARRAFTPNTRLSDLAALRDVCAANPRLGEVTLEQLLLHTSGLPRDLKGDYWETGNFPEMQDVKQALKIITLSFPPGEKYKYSNVGYALLSLVIESAQLRSVQELTRELFAGTDLSSVFDRNPQKMMPGHCGAGLGRTQYRMPLLKAYAPLGGATMSTREAELYLQVHLRGFRGQSSRPLGGVDWNSIHRPKHIDPSWLAGASYGWRVVKTEFGSVATNSGSLPGYAATFLLSRDYDLGVGVLSNFDSFHHPTSVELFMRMARYLGVREPSVASGQAPIATQASAAVSVPMAASLSSSQLPLSAQLPLATVAPQMAESSGGVELATLAGVYYWLDQNHGIELEIVEGRLVVKNSSYPPLFDEMSLRSTASGFVVQGGLYDGEAAEFEVVEGMVRGVWIGGGYYRRARV